MPRAGEVVEVGGRPVVRLVPGRSRVEVRVVMTGAGHDIDLSSRPAAVLQCLHATAERSGRSAVDTERDLRAALDRVAADSGAWRPRDRSRDLLAELGGVAFPLLGAAYDRGCTPLEAVPRWAVPIVSCPQARTAARAAFGPAATRPAVRALARALARPDAVPGRAAPPGLASIALAVTGSVVLDGDRIAALVDATAADDGPDRLLTGDEIAAVRVVVGDMPPARVRRLLTESGTTAGGIDHLAEVGRMWSDVAPRLPHRVPPDLAGLRDVCRSLLVTDRPPDAPARVFPAVAHRPPPPPQALPRRPRAGERPRPQAPLPIPAEVAATSMIRPAPPPRRMAPLPEHPVMARAVPPPRAATRDIAASTALPLPRWLAAVDRRERGGIRLVLPRTAGDLERWGRLLRSCIGDFGPAVAEGAAALLGLFDGPRLIGCLHLSPDRTIVQMLGHANRPLPRPTRHAVLGLLEDELVISRRTPANRPWFAAPP